MLFVPGTNKDTAYTTSGGGVGDTMFDTLIMNNLIVLWINKDSLMLKAINKIELILSFKKSKKHI